MNDSPPRVSLPWERKVQKRRRDLTREQVVEAAMTIADDAGLTAVSIRAVAAVLEVSHMRLYRFFESKEELLDLMADAVYGELSLEATDDWIAAATRIAQALRGASLRHPWFVDLIGRRSNIGPNALAFTEAGFAAMVVPFGDIDRAMQALFTLHAYVTGAMRIELDEVAADRATGLDEAGWHGVTADYMRRMLATGRFPNLVRVFGEATHPPADVVFQRGLDAVLAGLSRDASQP